MENRFKVALSFPGERRKYVEGVAERLGEVLSKEKVFYDKYYEAELARPNLDEYLQNIYRNESDLIVIFLSKEYETKEWCGLEWRAIRDLIKRKANNQVMPMRFDRTEVAGLFSIDGYIDIADRSPANVAELALERLSIENIESNIEESSFNEDVDEVEITLDIAFEQFTPDREKRFLKALSLLLEDSDVKIRKKQPGSTKVTLDISPDQWSTLNKAINEGKLDEFKPKSVSVNSVQLDETIVDGLWAISYFRTNGLVQILHDLSVHEQEGLDKTQSQKLAEVLGIITNSFTEIPDRSVLHQSLYLGMLEFTELFKKWSDIGGNDVESIRQRRKILYELRSQVYEISNKIGKFQNMQNYKLNVAMVTNLFSALSLLPEDLPGIFTNLKKSIEKYMEKMP